MKNRVYFIFLLSLLLSCSENSDRFVGEMSEESKFIDSISPNYGQIIDNYLQSKRIEPTIIFRNTGLNSFCLLAHNFSWKQEAKGIEISVDNYSFSTNDNVTSNPVWGDDIDSVNFANYLSQINIYEDESLIGLVITNSPCTGLGCGVNYQIIYDWTTHEETYFGRFRTGTEFQLYNFNNDRKVDYLSKTFYGRNEQGIDTTKYVMYSKTDRGKFEKYSTQTQSEFWFEHIYTEYNIDLDNEKFSENWVERITPTE